MSAARTRRRMALIVEHNTWLRLTLATLFEEIGFTVFTASNGLAGLRLANDLWPSVVLLGADLPELSSAQLADELRTLRDPCGLGTQVIMTSELVSVLSRSPWERKPPLEQPLEQQLLERVAVAVQ